MIFCVLFFCLFVWLIDVLKDLFGLRIRSIKPKFHHAASNHTTSTVSSQGLVWVSGDISRVKPTSEWTWSSSFDATDTFSSIDILFAKTNCQHPHGGCKIKLSIWNQEEFDKQQSMFGYMPTLGKYTNEIDLKVKPNQLKCTEQIKISFKDKYLGKFAIANDNGNNAVKRKVENVENSNELETEYRHRIIRSFDVFPDETVHFWLYTKDYIGTFYEYEAQKTKLYVCVEHSLCKKCRNE